MKKLLTFVVLVFSLFIFSPVSAADTGWTVENFDVQANINQDRSIDLTEKIEVDFNLLKKHGIYRYIPYKYTRNGNSYNVRIDIDSVTDENNNKLTYKESRSGGNLEVKIGDADKYVSGKNTYIINYKIDRAINDFSDHDEFYWNVTGNEWPVEIKNSSIKVIWPESSKSYANQCFTGYYGSTYSECQISENNNEVFFKTDKELAASEGLTVVSGIELGVLQKYSVWKIMGWFFADNWPYLIPILVFVWLINNYYKNGKDPDGKKSIAPEFSVPKKLAPAILSVVHTEKTDTKDISATIIDLAVKGYLKIKELKEKKVFGIEQTDYEFLTTTKNTEDLSVYEKEIYDALFDGAKSKKLSSLKNKFYTNISFINKKLFQEVERGKFFEKDPQKTRGMYLVIGLVLLFSGFFFPSLLSLVFGSFAGFFVAFFVSGMLFVIFSFMMPKRTIKGVEVNDQIKGFKMYMEKAEKYRQKFYEDKKIFEKLLPYAMVFGMATMWAEKFKDMQIEKPDWYEGRGAFYPVVFANNLNNFQNQMNSTMVSRPSSAGSGGSGFSGGGSGGGFGGGGGGSW